MARPARAPDPVEEQLATAESRGEEMMRSAARASNAGYDRATARISVELVNGCFYAFPARLVEDLRGASDEELSEIVVDGLGFNLHWPALDVDLYVPALVAGVFGTEAWMARALARQAGRARSPAKAAAARANGAKGGRPRKITKPA